MASRGYWLVTNTPGRFGKSARQALRPGCEEHRCTDPEEMPEMEAWNPDPKSPRWSAERRAFPIARGRRGASQAPRHAAVLRAHRMPLHPGACRRSAHPSSGWKMTKTRARNAPRERDVLRAGLFDIVRNESV